MRFALVGLVLLLVVPGVASALPPPDPPVPGVTVSTDCAQASVGSGTYPPPSNGTQTQQGTSVVVGVSGDRCVEPIVRLCATLGVRCCQAPVDLCTLASQVLSVVGYQQVGMKVPVVGVGVCVTYWPGDVTQTRVSAHDCVDQQG